MNTLSRAYFYAIWFIHFTYLALFVGVVATVPKFIETLNVALQTILCLVLMYRFHPFRTDYKLREADASFIFGSASLLFTNVVLVGLTKTAYIGKYISGAQSWVERKKEDLRMSIHDQVRTNHDQVRTNHD